MNLRSRYETKFENLSDYFRSCKLGHCLEIAISLANSTDFGLVSSLVCAARNGQSTPSLAQVMQFVSFGSSSFQSDSKIGGIGGLPYMVGIIAYLLTKPETFYGRI